MSTRLRKWSQVKKSLTLQRFRGKGGGDEGQSSDTLYAEVGERSMRVKNSTEGDYQTYYSQVVDTIASNSEVDQTNTGGINMMEEETYYIDTVESVPSNSRQVLSNSSSRVEQNEYEAVTRDQVEDIDNYPHTFPEAGRNPEYLKVLPPNNNYIQLLSSLSSPMAPPEVPKRGEDPMKLL